MNENKKMNLNMSLLIDLKVNTINNEFPFNGKKQLNLFCIYQKIRAINYK